MTISTLLLMTAESDPATPESAVRVTPVTAQTDSTSRDCSCPTAAPTATADPAVTPSSPAPVLGLLTISWKSVCEGEVEVIFYHTSNSSLPVCHDSEKNLMLSLFGKVCQNKKGCKDKLRWVEGKVKEGGYRIKESGTGLARCETLRVKCTVEVPVNVDGELKAYKAVTALFCCVLLVLLLIRFTRPTVKALQKRLSDRRQNRWIGPTQSHSVSYHRGKTAVKNNDGEKRLSYPALERLAVSDSREPSSNRNSDYNF